MAIIKLKYSLTSNQPADDSLQVAEPAYSFVSDRLYIGKENNGVVEAKLIGGQYFTDMMDHTRGTLTANSAILVDANKHIDEIIAGGLTLTTSGGTAQKVTSIQTGTSLRDGTHSETALATTTAIWNYVETQLGTTNLDDLNNVEITSVGGANIILWDSTNSKWINKALSGDITINENGVADISASGVAAGSYGSATAIPTFTVAADGRLTAAGTVNIATTLTVAADAGSGNGVDLLTDTLTITGTGGIDTNITGDTVTVNIADGAIANAKLANSSFTITGDGAATDGVNLGETLTFSGGTGITSAVTDNEVTFTLDNQITAGTVGSSTAIPVITYNAQGQITSVSTASVGTTLSIAGDSGTDSVSLLSDTLTFAGDTGITTTVTDNNISIDLDDTAVTAGSYGSTTNIPVLTIDQQGRITAASTANIATSLTVVGDGANSTTIDLLSEGLTIAGGTGLTTSVDDATLPNIITIDLDNTAVTAGSYGSSSKIATFTVDGQGRLTAAGEADIATTLKIAADTGLGGDDVSNSTLALAGDTLTVAGGVGLTTTLADNSITVDLDDTTVNAGTYGSAIAIPQFTVDAQGRLTAAGNISLNANSFGTVTVVDTDSGFSWAETGSAVATGNAQTLQFVSGYGVNVDVDGGSDAVRFTNTGVTAVAVGTYLTVDSATGDITIATNATSANTVDTLVARDASGDFAANKVTLNEIQIDDININGNIITSTATNANIQITPNGAGIVEITKAATFSDSVTISGDLTVTGTTTTIDVTELTITDPMIYLSEDSTSDVVDIGFVGSYDTVGDGSGYSHTGLVRHAADSEYYLFASYDPEPAVTNIIDPTHASFTIATLNANIIGDITGNADSATILETARTIALSGDVVGSVSFNGSQDVTITTTIQPNSVVLGTDTTGNYVATLANTDGSLIVNSSGTESAAVEVELDVTSSHFVEGAQDAVGTAIDNGTHTNLTITYDDATNAINAAVATATRTTLGVAKFGYTTPDVLGTDGVTVIESGSFQFGFDGSGNLQLLKIDGGTF